MRRRRKGNRRKKQEAGSKIDLWNSCVCCSGWWLVGYQVAGFLVAGLGVGYKN